MGQIHFPHSSLQRYSFLFQKSKFKFPLSIPQHMVHQILGNLPADGPAAGRLKGWACLPVLGSRQAARRCPAKENSLPGFWPARAPGP